MDEPLKAARNFTKAGKIMAREPKVLLLWHRVCMCLGGKEFPHLFGICDGETFGVVVEIDVDIPLLEPCADLIRPLFQLVVRKTGVSPNLATVESNIGKGGRHLFDSWIIRGHRDAQGETV